MCVQDCSPDPHFCRTRSKPARGGVPRALGSTESEVTGKESGGHSASLPSLATSKPDFPLKQPHTGHCGAVGAQLPEGLGAGLHKQLQAPGPQIGVLGEGWGHWAPCSLWALLFGSVTPTAHATLLGSGLSLSKK